MSKVAPGFGPTAGRVFVQKIELKPDELIVVGTRPLDVFDQDTEKWTMSDVGKPVAIEIRLPSGEQPNTAVPRLLNAVFFKQTELAKLKCSAEEQQEFFKFELKQQQPTPSKDLPKLPDVVSLDELHTICLPGGDRGYKVGRGITAPHVKRAPDPQYDVAARRAKVQGTSVLVVVITPQGTTSAIAVLHSLGSRLDQTQRPLAQALDRRAVEAVSTWKFDPGALKGQPVPVVANVEVDFKLY